MKKSKFLQNSKDILSRSFNPTKCKTSLRLATSRLKLLRNKKEVQVNQMKREIAQLLETGQDQTAKIRVEHVIREEKLMGAYDLLEIYCELIVARLPIIETQKNCPIDMKEAITSLVFASPRCGDIPELLDVRKQFSAKYGKDFITAAIELRPQCGVSRLLVEKLSATAPDGQAKIKILSTIAEQHNVTWDPKSFEEKRSGESSSVKKENDLYSDPHFEAAEVHARPSSNMNSSPLNSVQQDVKISKRAENLPPTQTSGAGTTYEPKAGPAGEKMPQSFHGNTHSNHLNRERWNMEFKDAASAAQAAAESAERASYAARAAAELSSHGSISGPFYTESHKPDGYTSKDDKLGSPPNLNSFERIPEASVNKSSSEYTRLKNEHRDGMKPSHPMTSTRSDIGDSGGLEEYSQAVPSKSKTSADDDSLLHGVPLVHEYTQEKSSKEVFEPEMVMRKQSFSYETENENVWPEKGDDLGEGMMKKEKSFSSSYSQSGNSDYVNIFANSEEPKFDNDIGECPSVHTSEFSIHDEAPQISSHDFVAATFDQSDTDNDDPIFDRGPSYDEQNLDFHLHSLGPESPERTSVNTDSRNPRSSSKDPEESASPPSYFTQEESFLDISGNTTVRENSELDYFPAVRFDNSDGPSSESDDEDRNASSMVEDSRDLSVEHNERDRLVNLQFDEETIQSVGSPSKNEGSLAFGSEQFSLSSDDELSSSDWKRSQVNMFDADLKPSAKQPALGSKNIDNDSDPESGVGLNFGKLTGGFRHKGHNHLPLFKNRLDASSSVNKDTAPSFVERPNTTTMPEHKTTSTTQGLHSESDSDSSKEEEEYLRKSSGLKQPRSDIAVKTKLTHSSSNSVFCSDDSDLDEHPPTEPVTRKSHLRGGISRRTKASSSGSMKNPNSKMHPRSEALDSDGVDRKQTSYNTGTPKGHDSNRRNSGTQEKYEPPISGVTSVPAKVQVETGSRDADDSLGKQPSSFYAPDYQQEFQPLGKSEHQIPAEVAAIVQKPKISQKSSAVEEVANPHRKADAGSENPKTSAPSISKDDNNNNTKKATHVHPKLPDYDALVQSLRTNRS